MALIKQIKIGDTTYDVGVNLSNVTGTLPVANGGTGATTAVAALVNLGANKAIKSITRSGTTFTYTCLDGTTGTFTQQDNNTTYSAGTGISLSGTTFSNSGVRSIATGSSNGTISVNTNGTTANVAVKGLGSNAYTSTAYLPLTGGILSGPITFYEEADTSNWIIFKRPAKASSTVSTDTTSGTYYAVTEHDAAIFTVSYPQPVKIRNTSNGWLVQSDEGSTKVSLKIRQMSSTGTLQSTYTTIDFPQYNLTGSTNSTVKLAYTTGSSIGSSTAPIYVNSTGSFGAVTTVDIAHGGTGNTTGNAVSADMLSNWSDSSVAISKVAWQHNPWGLTSPKYVWGQAFQDSTVSTDTGNMTIVCAANSNVGGYGAHLCIDGGIATLGAIYGSTVYGAVWNDYAEYRQTVNEAKPGQVVIENGDGSLRLSTERLQPGCEVVSDTFGFAIGETDECKTPIAATGRVLVYTYEDRNSYLPGDAVCSAPDGKVSKMTREEIINYPERIIGTVSEIPSYEKWGSGNVEVNGRIWIRIR